MTNFRVVDASAIDEGADLDRAKGELAAVPSGPPDMEAFRQQIDAFIGEHVDALFRTCLQGHLTGSALIVSHDHTHVVMLFHSKLQRWLQPGGHADGEGNIAAVALREAMEETGLENLSVVLPAIDLDVHEIPERGDEPAHLHLDLRYLLLAPPDAHLHGNHESQDLRWVPIADVASLGVDEGLLRMVQRGVDATAQLSVN